MAHPPADELELYPNEGPFHLLLYLGNNFQCVGDHNLNEVIKYPTINKAILAKKHVHFLQSDINELLALEIWQVMAEL